MGLYSNLAATITAVEIDEHALFRMVDIHPHINTMCVYICMCCYGQLEHTTDVSPIHLDSFQFGLKFSWSEIRFDERCIEYSIW